MSGFCNFCLVWHSGSCCHPNRPMPPDLTYRLLPQEQKIMSDEPQELLELIDRYWDLAYAEGKEGRDHDTENGDAQKCRRQIDKLIDAIAQSRAQDSGGEAVDRTNWVAVEDALPPFRTMVQVRKAGGANGESLGVGELRHKSGTRDEKEWITTEGGLYQYWGIQCDGGRVTHWRALSAFGVAAEQPAKVEVPLCEQHGAGCNYPECPCDVSDPLFPQPSDPADAVLQSLREMVELRDATMRSEIHPSGDELGIVRRARALLASEIYEGTGCVFCDLIVPHGDNPCRSEQPASVDAAAAVPGDMWPTAELLCTPTGHYYWQTTFPVGDMPLGKYVLQAAAPTPEGGHVD